jgi:hypothetical protein
MKKIQCPSKQFKGKWDACMAWASSFKEDDLVGWRLPTIKELISVWSYEKGISEIGGMKRDFYWSATTHARDATDAWVVDFEDVGVGGSIKAVSRYARAVREI